jgi:hypothetical protein
VNKFQAKPFGLKIIIVFAAILLPIVLVWVAPCLGIREGGKISLSQLQVFYAVFCSEIVAAVYAWGVGNWSRFEPPPPSSDIPTPQTSGQAPAQVPPQPVQVNVALPANVTVAPPAQASVAPAVPPPGTRPSTQGGQ